MHVKNQTNHTGQFLHEMADGIGARTRWKGRREPFYRTQTVLHHTFEGMLLTKIVIDLEMAHGNTSFDPYILMSMALVHDLSEAHLDDLILAVKSKRGIRAMYKALEQEIFLAMTDDLPSDISQGLNQAFILSSQSAESAEAKLFAAIEELGYVLDALCALDNDKKSYIDVLTHHYRNIERLSLNYPSIKRLFELAKPAIDRYIKQLEPTFFQAQKVLFNQPPAPGTVSPRQ